MSKEYNAVCGFDKRDILMNVKLEPFVPEIVRRQDREKPWAEWIPGTVLFADVSGFTPMSEALAALGAEGAEILTDILNRYFAEMIGILREHGGQVMKFGGDAILCFLEGAHTLDAAMHASVRMQEAMKRFLKVRTPVKTFTLQMKIGVASGECLLAGLGDPSLRCEHAFAGEPVDLASEAEHHAAAGDIILAPDFTRVPEYAGSAATFSPLSESESPATIVRPYIIPEVYDLVTKGYQRYVGSLSGAVSVFLRFDGFTYDREQLDLKYLHSFVTRVLNVTQEYGGRLNRLSMGDKGSTMLILFGAPAPQEKKEQMACQWALDVRHMVRELFPEVELRVGMTTGRVFSGIVGGAGRWDFTVMGDCVNLAARLMQGAGAGQICMDASIREKAGEAFDFESLEERKIKGKSERVEVFALRGRGKSLRSLQSSAVYGRPDEIESIQQWLKNTPCMIVLEGEAGVGKSALASHVLTLAARNWKIAAGKGDITRRGFAYNPWRDVFLSLVFQGTKPTHDELSRQLDRCGFVDHLGWHADFLGVQTDAVPEPGTLNEESKKDLLHHQLSVLLLRAIQAPTLLFLDDLHWFKSTHLDLLTSLLNHVKDQPLAILSTARPDWSREPFVNRSTCNFLTVKPLERDAIRDMAEKLLEAPVRDNVVDYLEKQARGNPFFLRQLLDYLTQNELVTQRLGEWTLSREGALDRSLSGDEIVVTQVDQLSLPERMHLRAAACIGPTLAPAVLRKALGRNFRARVLQSLRDRGYLQDSLEGRLAFPHALFQEALYQSLLKRIRRQYHRRIGFALEEIHASEIDKYLPTLAHHFFEAGVRKKAIDYCIAAGNEYHTQRSFPEALHYLSAAYRLLHSRDKRYCDVGLRVSDNLLKLGKTQECLSGLPRLQRIARRQKSPSFYVACAIEFDARYQGGDFSYLGRAQKLLKNPELESAMSPHRILYYLALAQYRQGRFGEAFNIFSEIIKRPLDQTVYSSLMFCASIERLKGCFDKAEGLLMSALELSRESSMVFRETAVMLELGIVTMEKGEYNAARKLFERLLEEAESVGDYNLVGFVLFNRGTLEALSGHAEVAETCFRDAIQVFSRTGIAIGMGKGLLELGALHFDREEYSKAITYYMKAVDIFERTGQMSHGPEAYYNLAEVMLRLGRIEEARHWIEKGKALLSADEDPRVHQVYVRLETEIQHKRSAFKAPDQ